MNDTRLPSLNALRCFVVAGRCLSHTAAAAELGVTQSAVSRLIRTLEEDLGLALFERQGRGLALTAAGVAYHRQIAAAMEQITLATASLRHSHGSGMVTINVQPTLGMRWLVPRLDGFQQRHPGILVNVVAGDGPVTAAALGPGSLAIRYGDGRFPGLEVTRLRGEEIGVVAAPGYLRAAPPLTGPQDLPRHRLLRHTTRTDAWGRYCAAFGLPPPPPQNTPQNAPWFEHFYLLAQAAAAGLGLALIPLFLIAEELDSGRLTLALPDLYHPPEAYYLLHPPGADQSQRVRAVKSWLLSLPGA